MGETSIEWTDKTWNPVRGCSRVSPGCGGGKGEGGCYAERQAARFSGPGMPYEGLVRIGKQGPRWTGKVVLAANKLEDPLRWRKPQKIFVNSMSDLFHEGLKDQEIANVFSVMESSQSRGHIFQVLTKRARRMREWVNEWARRVDYMDDSGRGYAGRYSHVWLGVSAEDQERADERIPDLLRTPAAVRFVSYEPALGPVDLNRAAWGAGQPLLSIDMQARQLAAPGTDAWDAGFTPLRALDWVIVGGESGPGARPFRMEWAESTVEQCRDAGVACFVKQMGSRCITGRGDLAMREPLKDRHGGDMTEWPEALRVREFPKQQKETK